jgi:predicted amidohydrolase YtcJ
VRAPSPSTLRLILSLASAAIAVASGGAALAQAAEAPTLIVTNARITTQDASQPEAEALAVRDGVFIAVGTAEAVTKLAGPDTLVIDAAECRLIPGLIDSHLHATRGGRFYNLELRWDGVRSLADGLSMIREQASRTPEGQWVRVVGGWSPHQFAEKRMPTIAELNDAAGDTPTLVVFLYSQGFLNRAGAQALGITPETEPPAGGRFEFIDGGVILHAEPNPMILYGTIARLPSLSAADQMNSTRHFYRELNRFGLTSVIDPGGGGHAYPADYTSTTQLARERAPDGASALPIRISNYLFAQKPGSELGDVNRWTQEEQIGLNRAAALLNGYVIEGAGENLVWSAGDFENFMAARPEFASTMERDLTAVVRVLAEHQWPIRIHATYDESITRILDVFEPVFAETGYTARWAIDHAETISAANIARIKRLGGGIAVQNRMAFAGEIFMDRYGPDAAGAAPPLRAILNAGIPLGAGTDATRVSSYNPWWAIHWLVTGKSVGDTTLASPDNRLTREESLRIYTIGSAWFSNEESVKGRIAPGQFADFAILSDDYFTVPDASIRDIESVLTVVEGRVVYGSGPFESLSPRLPEVSPTWSPVTTYGGFRRSQP